MTTPATTIRGYVGGFEGLLSVVAADNGNWYDPTRYAARLPQRRGCGTLVGSMRGVTAYAYAAFTGQTAITRATMAAITIDQAVAIGMALFYTRPGLSNLAWNRVTASILDKCWGSGTQATIRRVQKMVGAGIDGVIGPNGETARKFAAWIAAHGEEGAARLWCQLREGWDTAIATGDGPTDPDHIFLAGWDRRSESFLPGTPFWAAW